MARLEVLKTAMMAIPIAVMAVIQVARRKLAAEMALHILVSNAMMVT
jgi:hypothetical protein